MLIEIKDKSNQDLHMFFFCTKIVTTDRHERRPHMLHVVIQDGYVLSTDSTRIHKAKLYGEYDSGMYRVLMSKKTHVILLKSDEYSTEKDFPSFNKLIDEMPNMGSDYLSLSGDGYISGLTKIIRSLPKGITINPKFVKDLDDDFYFSIGKIESDAQDRDIPPAVYFEGGNKFAIIMTRAE